MHRVGRRRHDIILFAAPQSQRLRCSCNAQRARRRTARGLPRVPADSRVRHFCPRKAAHCASLFSTCTVCAAARTGVGGALLSLRRVERPLRRSAGARAPSRCEATAAAAPSSSAATGHRRRHCSLPPRAVLPTESPSATFSNAPSSAAAAAAAAAQECLDLHYEPGAHTSVDFAPKISGAPVVLQPPLLLRRRLQGGGGDGGSARATCVHHKHKQRAVDCSYRLFAGALIAAACKCNARRLSGRLIARRVGRRRLGSTC